MDQPILLLMRKVTTEQMALLENTAKGYRLLKSTAISETDDLSQVEIVFGWEKNLGEKLLKIPNSRLKWVQVYSAGVDQLPLQKFKKDGILLSNASGVHGIPITETVIGILLSHYRGLRKAVQMQTQNKWDSSYPTSEVVGKSMLIVGTGSIGRQLAKISNFFGIKVYGINRSGYPLEDFIKTYPQTNIEDILPEMDIVVNILPLTNETLHFYNENLFAKMKDQVLFVNVGRGPSVDTGALISACQSKKIGLAAIDVFETEPLPSESPLWRMENVLITPHISGKTDQYSKRFFEIFSQNIEQYLINGQLACNQIELNQGY